MLEVKMKGACQVEDRMQEAQTRYWFVFVVLYLFFDYVRPQSVLPIGFLRPSLVITIVLVFFIIRYGALFKTDNDQLNKVWGFTLLLGCYAPFAVNNFLAYSAFRTMMLYMPFIISIVWCVNTLSRLKNLVLICVIFQIYIAVYAITHAGRGPGNYFGDENDLALYMNMWLPFSYYLFFYEPQKKMKVIYATAFVSGLASIVISFSRGGFIGLLAVSATIWFFSRSKLASSILLLGVGLALFLLAGDLYWLEMNTVTDIQGKTANSRILSWKSAWRMFLDNPLGVGGFNFPVRFPEYQIDGFSRNMWGRQAHSLWCTLISEMGIIGTVVYFSLLRKNIFNIWQLMKPNSKVDADHEAVFFRVLGLSLAASLMGFFASATFLSVLYYAHYWYMTAIIIAALNIFNARRQYENTPMI